MTESIETAERLFIEDFDTWDMTGYYLYSKLLRSGVSRHIGTGGTHATATKAIPSGAIGNPGIRGPPKSQLTAAQIRTQMPVQIGGGSLSITELLRDLDQPHEMGTELIQLLGRGLISHGRSGYTRVDKRRMLGGTSLPSDCAQ